MSHKEVKQAEVKTEKAVKRRRTLSREQVKSKNQKNREGQGAQHKEPKLFGSSRKLRRKQED